MRIGIDFDNTLVCYDHLFWKLGRDRNVIDDSVPQRKDAVRDELRRRGLESVWTTMQGEAYGSRILEAIPFPGVGAALAEFRQRGWSVFIVSHKTQTPFSGPEYDLHAAARGWLESQGLLGTDGKSIGLSLDHVFLEVTKADKLRRIAELKCDWFVDDLPELLADPEFPTEVGRLLFDPHRQFSPSPDVCLLHDWHDAVVTMSGRSAR